VVELVMKLAVVSVTGTLVDTTSLVEVSSIGLRDNDEESELISSSADWLAVLLKLEISSTVVVIL
jgi:hypothetical protein